MWILAILALAAAGLAARAGVEIRLAGYREGEVAISAGARSALVLGRAALKKNPAAGSLGELWSNNPALFKDRAAGDALFTLEHPVEGGVLNGFEDEAARIPLNMAPRETLERLFAGAPEAAAAVVDWRDADDQAVPGGAEKDQYAGIPPRNGNFRTVEELLLVKGVTPALFLDVKDFLTVQSQGKVNLNTASRRVLEAVGLEPSLVEKVLLHRRGEDGVEGSADDAAFPSLVNTLSLLSADQDLSPLETASFQRAAAQLTTTPSALRMTMTVRSVDGRARRRFAVVLPSNGGDGPVLYWREDPA